MKHLIFLLISYSFLFSNNELDSLLENYIEENDLSNETKIDNTGTTSLILYTRKDLDELKLQSLKDILIGQSFFPYQESRFGYINLGSSEPLPIGIAGQLIKIFIDDHEISSFLYGTGLTVIGDLELDFVDHIEIYEGSPSYEFATDGALLTIKLYSKTAKRDNGNKINLLTTSKKGHKESFFVANDDHDLKYFLYFSNNNNIRDKVKNGNANLSRNEKIQHVYSKFDYKENNFILQYLTKDKDAFLTNSKDGTPTEDTLDNDFIHLAYKRNFLKDNSLELKVSYLRNRINLNFEDDNPIYIKSISTQINGETLDSTLSGIPIDVNRNINITGEKNKLVEEIKNINLKKKFSINQHEILLGGYIKQKSLSYKENIYKSNSQDTFSLLDGTIINNIDNGDSSIKIENKFDRQNYYSIYFQDKYKIDKSNSIIIGLKADYEDNNYFDDEILLNGRIAYEFNYNNFTNSLHYSFNKLNKVPLFYNLASKNTENQVYSLLANELEYKDDNYSITYSVFLSSIKKSLVADESGLIVNNEIDFNSLLNSINLKYNYGKNNYFMIEPWIINNKYDVKYYYRGLSLRWFKIFNKYSITNELILVDTNHPNRDNELQSQYNVTLAYKYNKDLFFYLKAYNIFNSYNGTEYLNFNNETKQINQNEKRILFGIEYSF